MNPRRTASRLMKPYRQLMSVHIQEYNHLRLLCTDPRERCYWTECIRQEVIEYGRRKEELTRALQGNTTSKEGVDRAPWYVMLHNLIGIYTSR